jgi:uncharacterized protein YbjT (DUF2867 family)
MVLVAGAGGAVGRHVIAACRAQGRPLRVLSRDAERLRTTVGVRPEDEVVAADLTVPGSLDRVCDGVDVVISTVGAPLTFDLRARRSYMEVDFAGNARLLDAARAAGVSKFVYVSVWGARELPDLEYTAAHERFVDRLAASGMSYAVVRPTGCYWVMLEVLRMAARGLGVVIGRGDARINPVHEADVAEVTAAAISGVDREIGVGGPDIFTRRRIVELAFEVLQRKPRIVSVPPRVFSAMTALARPVNRRVHAFLAFGAAVSTREVVAPAVGRRDLRSYFATHAEGA